MNIKGKRELRPEAPCRPVTFHLSFLSHPFTSNLSPDVYVYSVYGHTDIS
jgi:hypothetical protein